ncbi:hypothetical protein [Bradyrhizobium brasilense]|uniref:hypothetical protein n=1 Tax=Bradyrhizobium brasilense TaxID=1419277 RepID=UPI003221CFB4
MKLAKSPSRSPEPWTVFVGRNRRGNWVARERNGIFGGLFVNRAQALKYALWANGRHPATVVEVSREIELEIPVNPPLPGRTRVAQHVGTIEREPATDVCCELTRSMEADISR